MGRKRIGAVFFSLEVHLIRPWVSIRVPLIRSHVVLFVCF